MDSNNEYCNSAFWGPMSLTYPPDFEYPESVAVTQPTSHATYMADFRIDVVEEIKLPF